MKSSHQELTRNGLDYLQIRYTGRMRTQHDVEINILYQHALTGAGGSHNHLMVLP